MIRRPPRSTPLYSSAASDVYKRQALDNMSSRKILAKGCAELKIPLVHGAIAGWYGQVSTIMPGDNTMERLYRGDENKGVEVELGNPAFTPALVASIQVAE